MASSDAAFTATLLTQRLLDVGIDPLTPREFWQLANAFPDLAEVNGRSAEEIAAQTALPVDVAQRAIERTETSEAVALALEEAASGGLHVLAAVAGNYPAPLRERLGGAAPPLLYVIGEPALLSTDLLGVVGSRDVDERAAATARAAGAAARVAGWGVVSGGAKGVDRLSMEASLEGGGVAVGVLADSLLRAARDPVASAALAEGRLCFCTPFAPSGGFTVAKAMGRNKVIYGLARGTLVVTTALEKGGTWSGATEALKRQYGRVVVWTGPGAGPGNEPLVRLGGTSSTDVGEVIDLVRTEDGTAESPKQLGFGL